MWRPDAFCLGLEELSKPPQFMDTGVLFTKEQEATKDGHFFVIATSRLYNAIFITQVSHDSLC